MRAFRYIQALGARQHSVVRADQMRVDSAVVCRAVAAGLLYPRYRGVYGLVPNLTREGEWLAAVFAAGDGAALASLDAAVLRNISRFKPNGITVAVPKRRRPQPGLRLIVGLDPRDVRARNAIPVTTVERVLIDLTDVRQPEQIANVIHEAAFRQCFSAAATRRAMTRTRKRRMSRLERAIEMHLAGSAGTRSGLEDRFMALARAAWLPEPVINTHIHGVEVDFRWGDYCVEIDGPNHLRPATKARDEANDAWLAAHGLTVVRFTEVAIDREPGAVLDTITTACRRRPLSAGP